MNKQHIRITGLEYVESRQLFEDIYNLLLQKGYTFERLELKLNNTRLKAVVRVRKEA